MGFEGEFLDVYPVWNDLGILRFEGSKGLENLFRRRDPAVDSTVEEFGFDRIQQVPSQHHFHRKTAGSGQNERVVSRNVRMHDIEVLALKQRSQAKDRVNIERIQEREFDLRPDSGATSAYDNDVVTEMAKHFG